MTRRALILARGLGSRMRAGDPGVPLDPAQARAADSGLKAMFPIHGRPLLDYGLSELADAGLTEIGFVVAPEHDAIREYYGVAAPPSRVHVSYIVQPEPLGTANALLAAEAWTAGEPFLALNADNIYPARALAAVAALDEPGLPVFEAADLVRTSNIPAERIAAFAIVTVDREGYLEAIIEKPGGAAGRGGGLVSMNCWRLDARIFRACREVPRSSRGEYELPEAVGLAVRQGVRFRAVHAEGPVLDLSRRADAADLERRLTGVVPRP